MSVVYTSCEWAAFKDGERSFFADRNMLLGADGKPLTKINYYNGHLVLQHRGLRGIDDREFNAVVNEDPDVAEQMKIYSVWTSFLRNVEKEGRRYSAKLIARPGVSETTDGYVVNGSEKTVKLPLNGWFVIRKLLESESGLPEDTYKDYNMTDEPCAYFAISEGAERPVIRGDWGIDGRGRFCAIASWGPLSSDSFVGIRAASDTESNLEASDD